ncbi:DUF5786 family protein [Halobium salinum]|uniref:DUF5786 family protein n=1 Tax=Halobium salinum TaxID=1364940 RepID=A0ABD5PFP9_9EURY|nr:DUF5786 family protein [Halobium salinum]
MGFGSYDESEQRDDSADIDEDVGDNVHDKDHDGKVSFDTDESNEELVSRLGAMRDARDDEDED